MKECKRKESISVLMSRRSPHMRWYSPKISRSTFMNIFSLDSRAAETTHFLTPEKFRLLSKSKMLFGQKILKNTLKFSNQIALIMCFLVLCWTALNLSGDKFVMHRLPVSSIRAQMISKKELKQAFSKKCSDSNKTKKNKNNFSNKRESKSMKKGLPYRLNLLVFPRMQFIEAQLMSLNWIKLPENFMMLMHHKKLRRLKIVKLK